MAKKNKLTLASVRKAAGVGSFVEMPVSFQDDKGEEYIGEILVKKLSHNERVKAINEWGLEDKTTATLDHVTRSFVFASIYTEEDKKFFESIEETGDVPPEFLNSLYTASEKVNDFSGKSWILNQKNSGASSSSTELAEEPLKKQNSE